MIDRANPSRTANPRRWPSSRSDSPLLTSLIAHWRLDEASGTRADAHSNGLDLGASNAPGNEAGKIGNAVTLVAASTQNLFHADDPAFDFGNEAFTISGWVKPDVALLSDAMIVSKWSGPTNYAYCLYIVAGVIHFYVSADGAATSSVPSLVTMNSGTWYHFTAWHDATADTLNVAINDGAVNSAAHAGGCFAGSTAGFRIGTDALGASRMGGAVDSVSLWRRLLTAQERTALYGAGAGLDYPYS